MPKVDHEIDSAMDAWEEFEDRWKRSRKGNLWKHWDGLTLTVFRREGDGWFAWSIADADGPRFSQAAYRTEEEALTALGETLGVWEG
jgi:hypothetical protein